MENARTVELQRKVFHDSKDRRSLVVSIIVAFLGFSLISCALWIPGERHPDYAHVFNTKKEGIYRPEPGYDWVTPGTLGPVSWLPGMEHRDYPHVYSAKEEGHFRPAPGYNWVTPGTLGPVSWVPGIEHRDYPHVYTTKKEGYFGPAPGYDWVTPGTLGAVSWVPGFEHRDYPHVYTAKKEGYFGPAPGYDWVTPGKLGLVHWTPGTEHRDFPNVIAGDVEGLFRPKPGYQWLDPTSPIGHVYKIKDNTSVGEGLPARVVPREPVRFNLSDPLVVGIQEALAEKGFDLGRADGVLGARTEKAIRSFQQSAGLTVDGKASTALLTALRSSTLPTSSDAGEPAREPNIVIDELFVSPRRRPDEHITIVAPGDKIDFVVKLSVSGLPKDRQKMFLAVRRLSCLTGVIWEKELHYRFSNGSQPLTYSQDLPWTASEGTMTFEFWIQYEGQELAHKSIKLEIQ